MYTEAWIPQWFRTIPVAQLGGVLSVCRATGAPRLFQ